MRVARAGKEIGAFAPDAIADLLADGTLRQTDHYWEAGMSQWASLSAYPRVAPEKPIPTPGQSTQADPVSIVGLVVFLLGLFALFDLVNGNSPSPKRPEDYPIEIRATVQAEQDVRNLVSTPSTVKIISSYLFSKDDVAKLYSVQVDFDAQNNFGALVRSRYLLEYKETDSHQLILKAHTSAK